MCIYIYVCVQTVATLAQATIVLRAVLSGQPRPIAGSRRTLPGPFLPQTARQAIGYSRIPPVLRWDGRVARAQGKRAGTPATGSTNVARRKGCTAPAVEAADRTTRRSSGLHTASTKPTAGCRRAGANGTKDRPDCKRLPRQDPRKRRTGTAARRSRQVQLSWMPSTNWWMHWRTTGSTRM